MKLSRRIFCLVIIFALMLSVTPSGSFSVLAVTEYGLWVNGVSVSSENRSDILGDGTASYDSSNQILRLSGAVLDTAYGDDVPAAVYSIIKDYLIIEFNGDNTIDVSSVSGSAAVYSEGDLLTLGGSGSVSASGERYGILQDGNINITGASVSADGASFGVRINGGDLNFLSGGLSASGDVAVAVYGGDISLAAGMSDLEGGTVESLSDEGGKTFATVSVDGAPAAAVNIRVHEYVLWIGGKQVTGKNADDIFGNGKASYDAKTRTLTLSNIYVGTTSAFSGTSTTGIYSEIPDLTICLVGENTVGANPLEDSNGITSTSSVTVTGNGSLTVSAGTNGISVAGTLVLNGGTVSVNEASELGITSGSIHVKSGSVSVKNVRYGYNAAGDIRLSGGAMYSDTCDVAGVNITGGDFIITGGKAELYGQRYGIYITSGTLDIRGGVCTAGKTGNIFSTAAVFIPVSGGGGIRLAYGVVDVLAGAVPTTLKDKYNTRFYGFAADGVEVNQVMLGITDYTVSVSGGSAYVNGEIVNTARAGSTVVLVADTAPEGYRFTGWSVTEGDAVIENSTSPTAELVMPMSNVIVTANFEKIPVTVTFTANGGTGDDTVLDCLYGDVLTLPECTFTPPAEYEFKCWIIDGECFFTGDPITLTSDVLVEAVWRHSVKSEIDCINITGVVPPLEYSASSDLFVIENSDLFAEAVSYWYDAATDTVLVSPQEFRGDGEYVFVVRLRAVEDTHVFADVDTVTVTVNGISAAAVLEDGVLTVRAPFDVTPVDGDLVLEAVSHLTDESVTLYLYCTDTFDGDVIADALAGGANACGYTPTVTEGTSESGYLCEEIVYERIPLGSYTLVLMKAGHITCTVDVVLDVNRADMGEICLSLKGDANADRAVNLYDASLILRAAAGWSVDIDTDAADVTGDGLTDTSDVSRLMKYLAGWDGVTLD